MKCPLLAVGYLSASDHEPDKHSECLQRSCTWWDKGEKACFIQVWTAQLYEMNKLLEQLKVTIKAAGPNTW